MGERYVYFLIRANSIKAQSCWAILCVFGKFTTRRFVNFNELCCNYRLIIDIMTDNNQSPIATITAVNPAEVSCDILSFI